jgi:dihydrofolate reductase
MIKAIVAMDPHRLIGNKGKLPWHFSEDLQFFKRTTLGHPIVMGRKTFTSLPRPLPGRKNVVLSRSMSSREEITLFSDLQELLDWEKKNAQDIFIIGGAEIYRLFLPYVEELFVTHIHQEFVGDTFFPIWEEDFDSGEILEEHPGFTIKRHIKK